MARYGILLVGLASFTAVGCGGSSEKAKFENVESALPVEDAPPAEMDSAQLDTERLEGGAPPESAAPGERDESPRHADPRPYAPRDGNSYTTIRVFYGTDRAPTGASEPAEFFGVRRNKLTVGFADVSIPPNHETGELESPSIWKLEFKPDPEKHVVLLGVEPTDGSTFIRELRSTIKQSEYTVDADGLPAVLGGEAFVFVHGFNVTFEDAARRTAQIAFDLQFRGAPVMFSWPSQGSAGLNAYREDGRAAEWCEEHLMDFVTAIAQQSGARRVHIIAHSMGNRVVAGALRRLAWSRRFGNVPRFNEVILTAPDIDARTFKQSIAPRIVQTADRITIYASSNDVALKASSLVNNLEARLGQGGDDLTVFPELSTINVVDASDVDTSLFAFKHSYVGDSRTILTDLRRVLRGSPPENRGLTTLVSRAAWKIGDRAFRVGRAAGGFAR